MTWWNQDNPSHCLCPRSRYNPRIQRPTNPECPQHGEQKTEADTLKKPVALTAIALLAAGTLLTAAPAQADSGKVDICHATSAANGKYVKIEISKDGTANGHAGDSHQDGRDIIPAYSWVEDQVRHYFPGQNLDQVGLIAKGCKAPADGVIASPVPPTYVPASCAAPELPYGRVIVPAVLGNGVASATVPGLSPDNTAWSVAYSLQADTEDTDYSWPAGLDGKYNFTVVPITADPLWITDSKTGVGSCELPDTGAADFLLPGLLGAGALAAGAVMTRRRGSKS